MNDQKPRLGNTVDPGRINNHAAFIWSVANLLRGPYKPHEYGKVILPLTVLRRMDSVLEPTKAKVLERLSNLPQPVIAAVHGHCYTGGLELALACDFIFAMESARFADTHGKWGLVASWGSSQRLPRRIGKAKAKEMGFTSRIYSAAQAASMGLADFCVSDENHEQELAVFIKDILANSWHTNRSVKRMLAETDGMSLSQGLAHEAYRHPGRAPDMQERVDRFAKK